MAGSPSRRLGAQRSYPKQSERDSSKWIKNCRRRGEPEGLEDGLAGFRERARSLLSGVLTTTRVHRRSCSSEQPSRQGRDSACTARRRSTSTKNAHYCGKRSRSPGRLKPRKIPRTDTTPSAVPSPVESQALPGVQQRLGIRGEDLPPNGSPPQLPP